MVLQIDPFLLAMIGVVIGIGCFILVIWGIEFAHFALYIKDMLMRKAGPIRLIKKKANETRAKKRDLEKKKIAV